MNIKISPKAIMIFVLSFFLLNLPSLDYLSKAIGILVTIFQTLSAIMILGWYLLRKKPLLSPITALILIMTGMMFISTLVGNGSITAWFKNYAQIFALGLLFEISLYDFKIYLKSTMFLLVCLCLAHLLIIFLFPDGFYEDFLGYRADKFLLGQKNAALPYLMVACVTAFFYGYYGGNKLLEISVYSLSIVTSILVDSSTSTVVFILLVALFILIRHGMRFKIYHLLTVNVILFLILVVFRVQISILNFFIEYILKKSVSLTGRDVLWDMTIRFIRQRPILGYGVQSDMAQFGTFGLRWSVYAHNQILQELFDGGAVQLSLFLLFIIMISRKLNQSSELVTSQAMIVTLFVLNIAFITEAYRIKYIYLVYFYAYHTLTIERYFRNMQICKEAKLQNSPLYAHS